MPTPIYRITHYKNIPFILENGLWCSNCETVDPAYVNIGHKTLIDSRGRREVPIAPRGVLNDYVPFYFANRSPMLYVIYKGEVSDYDGSQEDIVYLVSTVEKINEAGIPFVFTDKHAKLQYTNFFNQIDDLEKIDWSIIRDTNWSNTTPDNTRQDKKQAEFLVHNHVPINCLIGIGCMNETITNFVQDFITKKGIQLPVKVKKDWYY